jgi:CRP/FNR family transcriptional regulator, nitrogen oxide reductase regulator
MEKERMPSSGIAIVPSDLRSQFLDGLHPSHRKTILSGATPRRFAANSVATNQGHPADYFFLLTMGSARYFFVTDDGKKLLLRWLGPGDAFGGRTVLSSRSPYLVSTEMITDSSALVWDRTTIRSLAERFPRLLENALLMASDYVTWHLTAHIGLVCLTARQRVAQVLITLGRTIGKETAGGIVLDITNEDLANAANVTPFTASRLISEWQRGRVLEKRRGKVVLRSPERLLLNTI